jgi:hypothetical protein
MCGCPRVGRLGLRVAQPGSALAFGNGDRGTTHRGAILRRWPVLLTSFLTVRGLHRLLAGGHRHSMGIASHRMTPRNWTGCERLASSTLRTTRWSWWNRRSASDHASCFNECPSTRNMANCLSAAWCCRVGPFLGSREAPRKGFRVVVGTSAGRCSGRPCYRAVRPERRRCGSAGRPRCGLR